MPRQVKDPDQRQRRNKAVTAATLELPDVKDIKTRKVPPLNAQLLGIKGAVKPQVQRWWREVWLSPMAPRWINTDIEVLYLCALLHHQVAVFAFEGKSVATLMGEIRQQEGRLGLDVLSRRRLDWRIEGPRSQPAPEPAQETPIPEPETMDPRRVLRAVQ